MVFVYYKQTIVILSHTRNVEHVYFQLNRDPEKISKAHKDLDFMF